MRALTLGVPVLLLGLMLGCEVRPYEGTDTSGWGGTVAEYPGFYWMVEGELAGMPRPGPTDVSADLAFLADEMQLDLLVSANLEPPEPLAVEAAGMDHLHLPIEDFQPPTQLQIRQFVDEVQARVDAGQRVGVHCDAGLGRTGTLMAAWLVWTGLGPDEAIAAVRAARPGSIETYDQELSVHRYASTL